MPAKSNNTPKKHTQRKSRVPRDLARVTQMPPTRKVLMTFATQGAGTEAAAGLGLYAFYRLNSVYDPDASGVGSTCGGYNTWSSLFLNYKVNKVTVRVQGTVECSNNSMCQVVIAPVAGQAVAPASYNYWKLIPGAAVYTLAPNANGGKNTFTHQRTYDNAAVARLSRQQYAVDMDFSGTVGSNPARQNYVMVAAHSINSSTPGKLINAIQITYEVEWFNPVPMQA